MEIVFTDQAVQDILFWKSRNKVFQERVKKKLLCLLKVPVQCLGKPKPLKFDLEGYWSKRINSEHTIVYIVRGKTIIIISARFYN